MKPLAQMPREMCALTWHPTGSLRFRERAGHSLTIGQTEVTRPTKLYMGGRAQAHYAWQSKGKQVLLLTSNVHDEKFAETRWNSHPQRHRESGLRRCDRIDVAVQLFSSQRSKTDAGSAT